MNKYSQEERALLVKFYYKSDENVTDALRKWSTHFKNKPKPARKTLEALIEKFERTGNTSDDIEARQQKPKTSRTPDVVEKAREVLREEPTISTRRLSQRIGVSQGTAWTLLNKDLKLFPYKVQIGQQLTVAAVDKRFGFACDICEEIDEGNLDPSKIIFSDEAHFWKDGYVNRQNYRIWGTEKPEILRTKPLHPQKVTVWCGLSATKIYGPYFIDESITSEVYNEFLKEKFLPVVDEEGLSDHYFQQDGAPPHSTELNLKLLRDKFGSKVIARRFPDLFDEGFAWPPYSPDLSPLDFFLWGYVKDKVYKENPKTITELKNKIKSTIEQIPSQMLSDSIGSFERRLRMLIHTKGEHIENILH